MIWQVVPFPVINIISLCEYKNYCYCRDVAAICLGINFDEKQRLHAKIVASNSQIIAIDVRFAKIRSGTVILMRVVDLEHNEALMHDIYYSIKSNTAFLEKYQFG
uniref:Uncharacterized protein n=1 Tax=Glossina pallidipes TaxID=7398 RepID=A0A1A9ZUV7_GLOPL